MTASARGSVVLDVGELTVSLPRGAERPFAAEDVAFQARAGEIVCIVGESGSGKSITGQAIFGLLPRRLRVTSGHARLQGTELIGLPAPALRRLRGERMAMIFQEPMTALNPVWSIGNQIEETFQTHTELGATQRRSRALDLLDQVGIPDPRRTIDLFPHQISGGQRQRVMIAMAVALDPVLLFADEPTTALDVTTQARILELIRSIQRAHGMAVVFVTHDFGIVSEIADEVVVMNAGRVVEAGPARDLLSRPRHRYTGSLIDAVPDLTPPPPRPSEGETVLSIRGLTKTFFLNSGLFSTQRRVEAVRDLSLELHRGETLGIVGESGSGKTTLSRLLLRLIQPTAGEITLGGRDMVGLGRGELRQARKDIQIVFQDPYSSLNPRQRAGDIIARGPMNFGTSRAEARARARELIALVGLEAGAEHRYPHQFSGGQRQRIGLARALALEPEVLIADEPVSALDVSVQAQVLRLLRDLQERLRLSMIFVTHDLRVAAQICDRVAVMFRGEVVEIGATAEIFAAPRHDYTRALLEAAPGRHWKKPAAVAEEPRMAQNT